MAGVSSFLRGNDTHDLNQLKTFLLVFQMLDVRVLLRLHSTQVNRAPWSTKCFQDHRRDFWISRRRSYTTVNRMIFLRDGQAACRARRLSPTLANIELKSLRYKKEAIFHTRPTNLGLLQETSSCIRAVSKIHLCTNTYDEHAR